MQDCLAACASALGICVMSACPVDVLQGIAFSGGLGIQESKCISRRRCISVGQIVIAAAYRCSTPFPKLS